MKTYKVGLLMGVFDLFHVGHLQLIRNACEHCEYLRVGVLSDDLVRHFKGHDPVIGEEERRQIIEAVKGVDEAVIIRDEVSRIGEWYKRPYDCFFSGDDHAGNPYWEKEREELQKLGADIQFFPYTESQSTTAIIQRILKNSGEYKK